MSLIIKKFPVIAVCMLFCAFVSLVGINQAHGVEEGEQAPGLSLPQLQLEGQVNLADYKGSIVYLDFWASWCPPCLVSMPIMNEMRNRLQSEGMAFEVVAVNVDSDPEDGIDFLLDKPVDFIVLADPEGISPADFAVRGMPTSFLIDTQGKVIMHHEGFKRSDGEMIEQAIRQLSQKL
jgi:cytochrome c biogenesis protein CcmG, thiol:disulfide interchange protein DsbE